jgi:hypothetical protein
MVSELDERIVYQSHILKFRSTNHDELNPYLLLALLSAPIVKEQIWAKRFTQDIIDTLGVRWRELVLPIPRDAKVQSEIIKNVRNAVDARVNARTLARNAVIGGRPARRIRRNLSVRICNRRTVADTNGLTPSAQTTPAQSHRTSQQTKNRSAIGFPTTWFHPEDGLMIQRGRPRKSRPVLGRPRYQGFEAAQARDPQRASEHWVDHGWEYRRFASSMC